MKKDSVIQKIRKLLKLQYGAEKIGSTGEAFQAAKMVQKLLIEYNLSMSDIDTSDGETSINMNESVDMSTSSMYGNYWKLKLLDVIAENNLCQAYKRSNGKIFVVGAEDNVIVVKAFYDYLAKTFKRLSKEHWIEELSKHGLTKSDEKDKVVSQIKIKFIQSYLEGVSEGLQQNYDSLKPTSEETALVVCHNEAIDDYVLSKYKMSNRKKRARTCHLYGDVYDLGCTDGRNVSLNKQIDNVSSLNRIEYEQIAQNQVCGK